MRLIVGVDGSDESLAALETVLSRARAHDDEVTAAIYSPDGELSDVESSVRTRLDQLAFDGNIELIEGNPGGRLVELADRGEYDRIVLSGGQRSPLGKIQLDSVVEFVLLNAHTTVTLIR
jgi:nucleotide-binding universal stress UspA family protein